MAAKIGNKYAEKYTREIVLDILNGCLETMNTPPYHNCLEYALKINKINRHKLHYFTVLFKDDDEVLNTVKDLKSEAESNNSIGVTAGETPVAWGVFNAKCNFGWVEKGVILETSRNIPLVKVVSYKADGTRVEQ